MASKRTQPSWPQPTAKARQLFLYNSLTRSKTPFVTSDDSQVTWYNCGPTVYDSAHMGHARNYISIDIIRRVLQSYFNYDVFFVQNVTDIDDKIIQRARQRYLLEQYRNAGHKPDRVMADLSLAIDYMKTKLEAETDPDKQNMLLKMITSAQQTTNSSDVVDHNSDLLSRWLDHKHGNEVNDNSIFQSLARHYENDYNEDMKSLNILPPDAVTRVSEFIPEIIDYIEVIIKNGFAYESNGSVYFDTNRFDSSPKHFYAKLVPEAFGDNKALAEGEGDLSHTSDKRNANDFALWKNSKPGEPWWQSPWGKGRPGWHIECSVMASDMIGQQMDIHSGGFDLKFPHHDNEMAQAEAYYNSGEPWINYFLHSGHLTISGCKMSKSLKNFITIKEALKQNTAKQLRFAFLLHSWKETLDYSENTMTDAIQYEKTVNEFLLTAKDVIRTGNRSEVKWSEKEVLLNKRLKQTKDSIRAALCDNIDTRTACEHIRQLISWSNLYLKECIQSPNVRLLERISAFINKMLDIFGVGTDGQTSDVGNREEILMPFLDLIADTRETIRATAKKIQNQELLAYSDRLRDEILPEVGVRLEDYEVGDGQTKTRVKLVDRETLLREKEEKLKAQELKRLEKERKAQEKALAEAKKAEEKKLCPTDMFATADGDKYSAFDPKGMPTHDFEGKELTKSQLKKLQKLYSAQLKKHQKCVKCENIVIDGQN